MARASKHLESTELNCPLIWRAKKTWSKQCVLTRCKLGGECEGKLFLGVTFVLVDHFDRVLRLKIKKFWLGLGRTFSKLASMNEQYDSISSISQVNVKNIYNSLSFDQFHANPNASCARAFCKGPPTRVLLDLLWYG